MTPLTKEIYEMVEGNSDFFSYSILETIKMGGDEEELYRGILEQHESHPKTVNLILSKDLIKKIKAWQG